MNQVYLHKYGFSSYRDAWTLQQELFDDVTKQRNIHHLVLTEHHPVITIGKSGTKKNLLVRPEYLEQQNIDLVEIDRGGDITFHGPGQLIGYPILDLTAFKKDVHWYLRMLEEIIIRTLYVFDIDSGRVPGLTGVWINNAKICAIGIKVTRWVTMHGFALNVNTDLSFFKHIIPCGINDKQVTSISQLVGNNLDINHVIKELVGQFEQVFEVSCISIPQAVSTTALPSMTNQE